MRASNPSASYKDVSKQIVSEFSGGAFPQTTFLTIPEYDNIAPEEDWTAGLPIVLRGIQNEDWNDVAQGIIQPYAPNTDFKTPEHADGSGQDEESYQLEDMRAKQTKEGTDTWLQPDEEKKEGQQSSQQGGSGGQGGQKQQKKGHVGGDKAVMKVRMNKDTGHTMRVGKDSRLAAHKDGAKIRMGSDWVVVSKGKIIFSKPPIIGKDPIKNDDK